jgi:glycoside/pentoside/hexuronide:cation symporter, GPH family
MSEIQKGFFYSFMVFSWKIHRSFTVSLTLQTLAEKDFSVPANDISQVQVTQILMAIRWSIGLILTLSLICGLICAYFYPITKEHHQQTLLALAE